MFRICSDKQTRRDFLQVGMLGALGFGLPHWFAAESAGAALAGVVSAVNVRVDAPPRQIACTT